MKLVCPSGPEFKGLENILGEFEAYQIWLANNQEVPTTLREALKIRAILNNSVSTKLNTEQRKIAENIFKSSHKGNFYVYNAKDRDRLVNKLSPLFPSLGVIKGDGQNKGRWTISIKNPSINIAKITDDLAKITVPIAKGNGEIDLEDDTLFSPSISSNNNIKPGVAELFESNSELANAVYEALGFKSYKNVTVEEGLPSSPMGKNYVIRLDGKYIGEFQVEGTSIFQSVIEPEFQGKGLGKTAYLKILEKRPDITENFSGTEKSNYIFNEAKRVKQQAQQLYYQYLDSLNKPNTNPILQNNQQEQVKKFAELKERLNNKEFLEGAKNAYESSKGLQEWGTQEQYNDYIARVSLGIIKNPSSGDYNYTSKVRDIVYHGTNVKFDKFEKGFGKWSDAFWFDTEGAYKQTYQIKALINAFKPFSYSTFQIDELIQNLYGQDQLEELHKYYKNPSNKQFYISEDTFELDGDIIQSYGVYDTDGNFIKDVNSREEGEKYIKENSPEVSKVKQEVLDLYENYSIEKHSDVEGGQFIKKEGIIELQKANFDSISYESYKAVFEPEQIHILGSKQDIEGFKGFVEESDTLFSPGIQQPYNTILDARNDAESFKYTEGQKDALLKIQNLVSKNRQFKFLLAGYAGTGKTTIIENIVNYIQSLGYSVVIAAPTNNAVKVIKSKTSGKIPPTVPVKTLHKTVKKYDPQTRSFRDAFPEEIQDYVIIDEASLIDTSMIDTISKLVNSGKNIIFIGDGFQLEPVGKDPKLFTDKIVQNYYDDHYQLTEVKRQANGNSILTVATVIRKSGKAFIPDVPTPNFQNIRDQSIFNEKLVEEVKSGKNIAIVTATNNSRIFYNNRVRQIKNIGNSILNNVETLVAISNAEGTKVNSEVFTTRNTKIIAGPISVVNQPEREKAYKFTAYVAVVTDESGNEEVTIFSPDFPVASAMLSDIVYQNKELENILDSLGLLVPLENGGDMLDPRVYLSTYGYSITAHKSQGGQWETVFIDHNYNHENWNPARWIYTAITRASGNVYNLNSNNHLKDSSKTLEYFENIAYGEKQLEESNLASAAEEDIELPASLEDINYDTMPEIFVDIGMPELPTLEEAAEISNNIDARLAREAQEAVQEEFDQSEDRFIIDSAVSANLGAEAVEFEDLPKKAGNETVDGQVLGVWSKNQPPKPIDSNNISPSSLDAIKPSVLLEEDALTFAMDMAMSVASSSSSIIPGFEGKSAHQSQVVRALALLYIAKKEANKALRWEEFVKYILNLKNLGQNDVILAAFNEEVFNADGKSALFVTRRLVLDQYTKYRDVSKGVELSEDYLESESLNENLVTDEASRDDSKTKEFDDKKSITENHTLKLGKEVKKLLFYIPVPTPNTDGTVTMNGDHPAVSKKSDIGLPELISLEEATTELQGQLSGHAPSWEVIKSIMQSLVKYKPWVQVIISRLEDKYDDKGALTVDRSQQRAQFVRWATKHYVDLKVGLWDKKVGKNGEYYKTSVISADQNNIEKHLKNEFNETLRRDTKIIKLVNKDGSKIEVINKEELVSIYNEFLDFINEVKGLQETLEVGDEKTNEIVTKLSAILNRFGVAATPEVINKFLVAANSNQIKSYSATGKLELNFASHVYNTNGIFNKMADGIRKLIEAVDKYESETDSEDKEFKLSAGSNPLWDNNGINDYIRFYANFIDEVFTNSYKNGSNDTIWSYSNNKEDINRLRELVETKDDKDGLANRLLRDSAFHSSSLVLDKIVNDPDYSTYTKIIYLDSIRQRTPGRSFKAKAIDAMSPKELSVFKMMSFFNQGRTTVVKGKGLRRLGTMFNMTMSDKAVLMGLQTILHNTNAELVLEQNTIVDVKNDLYNTISLKTIIAAEVNRINTAINMRREGVSIDNKGYNKGADIFFILPMLNLDPSTTHTPTTEKLKSVMYDANGILKDWSAIDVDQNSSIISDFIDELVENQTNIQLERWETEGLYNSETGEMEFIDRNYLYEIVNKTLSIPSQASVKASPKAIAKFIAMDYVVNYMLHYMNTMHLFYGDPALYYKKEKDPDANLLEHIQSTLINMGKRLASNNAPGYEGLLEISNRSPKANVVFVEDVETRSIAKAYIDKIVEEHAAYDKITSTDAQELNTLQEFAFRILTHGYISQSEYDEIMANYYNLSDRLIKKILGQPIKPVHRGFIIDANKKYERVVYIKTSAYPLIPQFVKGTPLEDLRKQLEEKDGKLLDISESINRVVFDSGVKVGGRVDSKGKYLQVWDKQTGRINSNLDFEPYTLKIDRKSDRIQQEVPYKAEKREVNRSTQVDQNLFIDQLDINGFLLPEWAGGKKVSGTEVKKVYDELQQSMYEEAWKELEKKIFVKGEIDRGKLADLIREEAVARNYPPAIMEYLTVNSRNRFKYALSLLPEADKVESLLLSIVDNKVRKKKMPGFSGVLASESGYEGISSDIVYTGNSTYIPSMGLKPQRVVFIKNGETIDIEHPDYELYSQKYKTDDIPGDVEVVVKGSQILVPWKFRDALGKIQDISEFMVVKDGVKYLDMSKVDKELLDMFAFRIPNQGPNSKAFVEVVGFLPEYMGDLVIATKDFTKQMGSDFDVDKLYVYMYGSGIINGKLTKITESTSYKSIKANMDELAIKYSEYEHNNLIRQNKNLDLHLVMLQNPNKKVQGDILTPLGFFGLDNLANKIAGKPTKEAILSSRLLINDGYQSDKFLSARGGKAGCLGYGTKVLMYDGTFKEVQNIIVGDKLMGVDSTPRTVLDLCRGVEQMYNVKQTKGITYRVNESHILSLVHKTYNEYSSYTENNKRYRDFNKILKTKKEEVVNIKLSDYLNKNIKYKNSTYGYKSSGIEFEYKNINLDPYYLGLWLGDGATRDITTIHNLDIEIIEYLKNTYGIKSSTGLNNISHSLNNKKEISSCFKKDFNTKRKGLSSHTKYIPDSFLYNTTENRLKLLAGLIDSDGHYCKINKQYKITSKYKHLAEQILFLTRSLGFYSSICFHKGNTKIYPNGKEYTSKGWYNITFIPEKEIPVKINRKKQVIKSTFKNRLHTGITIEKDIVDNYYGFVLDGDHLFMLEDFTVTHNTGVFSNSNTFNAILQGKEFDIMETDGVGKLHRVRIPFTKYAYELSPTLSHPTTYSGIYKHILHSAFQSAAVDEEKEQILSRLNINEFTMPIIWAMIQTGYNIEDIIYGINQPIVRDFVAYYKNLSDSTTTMGLKDALDEAIVKVKKKYLSGIDESLHSDIVVESNTFVLSRIISPVEQRKLTPLSLDKLQEYAAINNKSKSEKEAYLTNYEYVLTQIKVLDAMTELKSLGDRISSVQTTINPHSKGMGLNLFVVSTRVQKIMTNLDSVTLSNYKSIAYGNNVSSYAIKYALMKADSMYNGPDSRDLFYYNNSTFNALWKALSTHGYLGDDKDTGITYEATLKKELWNDFKSYMYSQFAHKLDNFKKVTLGEVENVGNFDIVAERERLFKNDDKTSTLGALVFAAQQTEWGKANKFLNKLEVKRDAENPMYDYIVFPSDKGVAEDERDVYQGFVDLFNNRRSFSLGMDLIMASYISGGMQQAMQYVRYIPPDILKKSAFLLALSNVDLNQHSHYGIGEDLLTMGITTGIYPGFVYQWLQHNPQAVRKAEKNEIVKGSVEVAVNNTGKQYYTRFQLNGEGIKKHSKIVSIGDSMFVSMSPMIKLIDNKETRLYMYNPMKNEYVFVNTLGNTGMLEYDYRSVLGTGVFREANNAVKFLTPKQIHDNQERLKNLVEVTENELKLTGTEYRNLLAAPTGNQLLDFMANRMVNMGLEYKTEVTLVKTGGYSKYSLNPDKVQQLSINTIKNNRFLSLEDIKKNLLHEYTHAVIHPIVNRYAVDKKMVSANQARAIEGLYAVKQRVIEALKAKDIVVDGVTYSYSELLKFYEMFEAFKKYQKSGSDIPRDLADTNMFNALRDKYYGLVVTSKTKDEKKADIDDFIVAVYESRPFAQLLNGIQAPESVTEESKNLLDIFISQIASLVKGLFGISVVKNSELEVAIKDIVLLTESPVGDSAYKQIRDFVDYVNKAKPELRLDEFELLTQFRELSRANPTMTVELFLNDKHCKFGV